MKGTKGKWGGWLGLLLVLVVVPCVRAVLFEATGDPTYNTNAPTGSLINSGWQYEGQWGSYLGTPIAPTFFLAAQHIGGSPGQSFVFNGVTYTTVTNFDDPSTDLRIWQVGQTFPSYAPLYTASNEVGRLCVVIGRGTQRGSLISVEAGRTNGWMWGAGDTVERWGENTVAGVYTNGSSADLLLYALFEANGATNECDLSVGDSSGGMFIENGTTWELAGIHYAVDGPFSYDGSGTDDFEAAVVDLRGLYYEACDGGCWTLWPTNYPEATPTGFYSTRVSTRISWINGVLTNRPTAVFSGSPTNGATPSTVTFTDRSTGAITNRFWSFGDGSTTNFVNATNPTQTYTTGVYNVTLTVSGPGGSNTMANLVRVFSTPLQAWQWQYFGCTNCAQAQPDADPSGTGMSNTNQFLAGFDPTNPAAYLHVISIATTNTTDMNVIYLGANGDTNYGPGIASRTNILEYSTGTANGSYNGTFLPVPSAGATNILSGGTGTGIVANVVDPGGATNTPSRYYRVRVLLP